MDKHELRDAAAGSDEAAVREWLIRGTDSGSLVRQELASMLPAATLQLHPSHHVLDMCAAPGSKTTQLVESLDGGEGVVVANDFSALRCYTLVKRTSSLGLRAASLVVTNHAAQKMPRPPPTACSGDGIREEGRDRKGYDRIVCDVPCTGDGTTRKHPEVFHRWEPALALRHHPLQLQIAMRGCALLEVGGLMCYSTCSLNPIENEAVVAELLRRCAGAVELVPGANAIATELAGGCAPGMPEWPLLDFRLVRHSELTALRRSADIPSSEKRLYMKSMWPPRDPLISSQLRRCVRLIPHRSDSGGFFIALLRKVRELPPHPAPVWPRATGAVDAVVENHGSDAISARSNHLYAPVAPAIAKRLDGIVGPICKHGGKADGGVAHRLFARTLRASQVVYMTAGCERYAAGAGPNRLHVVHAGVPVLRRHRGRAECDAVGRFGLTAMGRRLLAQRNVRKTHENEQ